MSQKPGLKNTSGHWCGGGQRGGEHHGSLDRAPGDEGRDLLRGDLGGSPGTLKNIRRIFFKTIKKRTNLKLTTYFIMDYFKFEINFEVHFL